MAKPHVLAIPVPAQGHVMPMMELARNLANQGVKVTFVNTEAIHKVVTSNRLEKDDYDDLIDMVSIPDGLESWEDRSDLTKLNKEMLESMPSNLEELIKNINKEDSNKITCIVADNFMGWAIQVSKKMGIRSAAFWPVGATPLATMISYQKLINDGIINNDGIPLHDDMIQLSPTMPPIKPTNLPWMCIGDVATVELFFQSTKIVTESAMLAEWLICNSSFELEPETFNQFPKMLPIGPLLASNRLANQSGQFWPEDATCIEWLDQQQACSVIYIAFGSITIFNQTLFTELAHGIELSNKPFMWVVRTGMTMENTLTLPDGYVERIGSRGKFVSWAPQQKVLAHPSVGCFMSHCGWNSTVEGVSNGLPFLCWPYFADHFLYDAYLRDVWKIGLGFKKDEQGVITRGEIQSKVEQLFNDKSFRDKALEIKEKVTSSVLPGGSSNQNLCNFIEWLQEKNSDANYQRGSV